MLEVMPAASVDFSVFSPPFPSLFSYTSKAEDIGNSEDLRGEAKLHLGWFYAGLRRVLKPGRACIVHVMQIPRLKRSGLSNVHPAAIASENDPKVKRLAGKIDRVLVDAPCSGSGTLRRNPDLKWRFDEAELARVNAVQHSVLRAAARLVRPGGRLVYATCSLLTVENQQVIERFLQEHPEFVALPAAEVLAQQGITIDHADRFAPYFVMLPHLHGTDGFFGAVLERRRAASGRA
jgi:16S rRNA (cytosine967-C5)-methyltransferase